MKTNQKVSVLAAILGLLASGNLAAEVDFEYVDKDGSGGIDSEEFRSHMSDTFYQADADRDNALAGDELEFVNSERMGDADKNGDGAIDLNEFLNATAIDFDNADRNDNHVLDPDEI